MAHTIGGVLVAVLHTLVVATVFASYYYGYSPGAMWDVFQNRMHMGYLISVFIYLTIAVTVSMRNHAAVAQDDPHETPGERYLRRVLIRADGRTWVLPVTQVDWFEAADNNEIVHAGTASHTVRGPLSRMAGRLAPARFARIHRSTVVNLESA
jgi:DNA-binding LytR/AlgR family response regulator